MPSRASKAELTVDSSADRDIGISLGFRAKLTGFFGIWGGRVKASPSSLRTLVSYPGWSAAQSGIVHQLRDSPRITLRSIRATSRSTSPKTPSDHPSRDQHKPHPGL